jgi:hypothetical protein
LLEYRLLVGCIRVPAFCMTFSGSLRGKVLEQIVDVLAELLNITVRIRGKILAVSAAPQEFLSMGVEDVDDDITDLCGLSCSGGDTVATKPAPAPPSSKTVIECIEGLLILRTAKCADRSIAVGINLSPSLGGKLGIDVLR